MANEKGLKELTITRTFDAPRELVWKAWTDPKLLKQWFGPRGVTNPICEVDARKGGEIYIVMEAGPELGPAKGMRWPMRGTFDEVVPYERFVLTGNALDDKQGIMLENRQTVILEDIEGKTKMTLHVVVTKVTKDGERAVAGMQAGFTQQIDKLGEFLMRAR
ncbi:MAG: SRPBCC domain-containing protein [Candidatus Micrarchaeota archaeon]|nr:SRPBCC domain-containing protein [Candidatus Micrarchaeota archaeon]MDE1834032.1 SRPBCC domain-containing protein [Candidatus Micrarchaeota archaeon]MDE1859122.1 SRPBCC domain-containing protein [Candidatus Micrarchaeota archaeon]